MAWVRSEYAGALAVLLTWAGALIPWSVSVAARDGVSLVVVRFPFFLVQFIFGANLGGAERPFLPVWAAPGFESGPVADAYAVWLAGAAVFAVAVAVSLVYYAREERVETGPVDPVRALGGLLLLTAVILSASTGLLTTSYAGTTVPVGVVFLFLFGGLLVTVDRQ